MPVSETLEPVRAKKHLRVPVVMTQKEVQLVLERMQRIHLLMAKLLYGGGLRLMECVRLRVQHLDFEKDLIYINGAKGGKSRTTVFPKAIQKEMQLQLDKVRKIHEDDLNQGYGEVLTRRWRAFWPAVFSGTVPCPHKAPGRPRISSNTPRADG